MVSNVSAGKPEIGTPTMTVNKTPEQKGDQPTRVSDLPGGKMDPADSDDWGEPEQQKEQGEKTDETTKD